MKYLFFHVGNLGNQRQIANQNFLIILILMTKNIKLLVLGLVVVGLAGCGADLDSKNETAPAIAQQTAKTSSQNSTARNPETAQKQAAGNVVVFEEFFDYGCGYCRKASQIMKRLRLQYGNSLAFSTKHFLVHENVRDVHRYSACVGQQSPDLEQDFHDTYFSSYYGKVSDKKLTELSQKVGADLDLLASCLDSDFPDQIITQQTAEARKFGARGTPFFLLNKRQSIPGFISEEQFVSVIDSLLE